MRTASPSRTVPTGHALRGELRRLRRARRARSWWQRAGDIYYALLIIAIPGGIAAQGVLRLLRVGLSTPLVLDPLLAGWMSAAACLVCAGMGLRALLSLGPIVAGPAHGHWLLATPVRRRSLLLPRFLTAVAAAAATGAGAGAMLGALVPAGGATGLATAGWSAVIGAAISAGLLAAAVALRPRRAREGRLIGSVLAGAGVALVIAVTAAGPMPAPATLGLPYLGLAAVIVAALLLLAGLRALDHLERAALSAGAGLAVAIQVSVTWMDVSILAGLMREQRLRRIARVRSRPLVGTGWSALLAADTRRILRAPGRLVTALALGVVPYAAAALLPVGFVPALTAILACVVAGLFADGLRAVAQSAGLRRNLPLTDRTLMLVHLAVPLVTVLAWTAGVLPALLPMRPIAAALIPLGAVLVVYRVARRQPLDYSGPVVVDPFFGTVLPVNLIRQLLRGPFLACVLAAIQILLAP